MLFITFPFTVLPYLINGHVYMCLIVFLLAVISPPWNPLILYVIYIIKRYIRANQNLFKSFKLCSNFPFSLFFFPAVYWNVQLRYRKTWWEINAPLSQSLLFFIWREAAPTCGQKGENRGAGKNVPLDMTCKTSCSDWQTDWLWEANCAMDGRDVVVVTGKVIIFSSGCTPVRIYIFINLLFWRLWTFQTVLREPQLESSTGTVFGPAVRVLYRPLQIITTHSMCFIS